MQMQQLRSGAQQQARATARCRPSLSSSPSAPRRVVRARAEPPNLEGNVTREYREDTGEVSVPTSKNADGSLYVDVNAPVREMKPRENISKEMKARLRKEYTDFGGTESKSMGGNYFLTICIIISVLAVMSKLIGAI